MTSHSKFSSSRNASGDELRRPSARAAAGGGAGSQSWSRPGIAAPPSAQGSTTTRIVVATKRSAPGGGVPAVRSEREAKVLLQFVLETSAQLLQPMAEFVGAYAKGRYHPRTAEKVALASHELVENAMSYGSVSADIVYTLLEFQRTLEVCVSNESPPGRISALQARLDRLKEDAEQVYLQEMSRSMSGAGGRLSLGLARICHEGQMDLEFELDGGRITMHARCSR